MGKRRKTAHDRAMQRLPDKRHLEELLDAALAGTFPASDPVSSFVSEREPPTLEEPAAQRRPAGGESEEQPDEQDVGEQAVDEPGRDEGRG